MANPLFDRVLPKELASIEQCFEFKGKIDDFDRLTEIIAADLAAVSAGMRPRRWRAAPVDIRLDFAWADAGQEIPAVTGRFSAQIPAVCQRCLDVFELSLDASLRMLLVRSDTTSGELPDLAEYEVWEFEDETLRPFDLVEESLVMTIPLAPAHESGDSCGMLAEEIAGSGSETARPFADLRSQMEKSKK